MNVARTTTIVLVFASRAAAQADTIAARPLFTWNDAAVYIPLKITNDAANFVGPLIRLKPGVTHAAANAELQPLLEQFAKDTP